ncbi:MAG: hypothetical protein GWO84_06940 [Euryarchaeota archaeon]|nr:hypothetical protein [Euryarchaeota archaeon]
MKMSARLLALTIVALSLGSLSMGFTAQLNALEMNENLENEPIIEHASSATSPGHVVFGQYISSDNCGHCSKTGGGSDAHHAVKGLHPDEYVYITYMSASYGDTDTARAGNVAPYNWAWSTGGAPDAYFGDRTDKNQGGASANYDTYDTLFSSGGGMASTTNDYGMSASISQSGGTYDIDISYKYTGSGSAASNMKLYAALVDEECTGYSYTSGIPHGYNCWMGWLTSGDTYKSKSAGTGTSFASVTPTATSQSQTWTSVPTSVVPGGLSKAIVIGVLMSGNSVSAGGTSEHVYHAIDSTMGPKMDLTPGGVQITNPAGSAGYVTGDVLTLQSTISNVGDLDYTAGGDVEFFYKSGINEIAIDTQQLNNLNMGATQTVQVTFDTSSLPSNAWKSTFGVRLKNLVDETNGANNVALQQLDHDRVPLSKKAAVLDSNIVERGDQFSVLAKGDANDFVDTIHTMSFDIEVSETGANQWISEIVSGGESVVYEGTNNEGREYVVSPVLEMSAGWYDIRSRTVDSRGQTGDWQVSSGNDGFKLANGVPTIVAEPVPSVMCDLSTKVDMTGHINDPETHLSNLLITSDDSAFIAWHPTTQELEVKFEWDSIQGCPLGQQGMEVKMDDGGDYSETGELPYGTLLFNVIENGQPRWAGLPTQMVDEGGSEILSLMSYVTDTDDMGQTLDISTLTLQVIDNTNPELITAEIHGNVLNFETVDDDVNGQTTLTLRASDGEQYSDQTIVIKIQEINDAPRVDMDGIESITIKRGTQMVIDLGSRISDVDDNAAEAYVTVVSSEPGAARFNLIDNSLTLLFDETGDQTITLMASDKYDTNSYEISVVVFDAYPFLISTDDDGSGHLYVDVTDTYISQTPTVVMTLTEGSPIFTSLSVSWNVCNDLTGTCDGLLEYDLDVSKSNIGWTSELLIPSLLTEGELARESGSTYMDYYALSITGVDSNGDDFKSLESVKWHITEEMPAVVDMDDTMFSDYLADLLASKDELKLQITESTEDTTELDAQLTEIETKLGPACEDPRAECPTEEVQSNSETSDQSNNMVMIIGVVALVIIAALLIGLMVMRRGNSSEAEVKWGNELPADDLVANSMYGGTQQLFQQPVAAMPMPLPMPQPVVQQPVIPQAPVMGPPIPAAGIPVGWTMEQWQHYGQQYLEGTI